VGVAPHMNDIRYGPLAAVPRGLAETWDKTTLTLGLLKKMVTGDVSMKNLSGPITIARVAGDSARSGWHFFLGVLALLSISLGVLNLLPIPILDGGHILFYSVEAVTGKPVSEHAQAVGTQIGLFLVAGLMILALYNDISRLF
jgi:regulator of sigma E protease